MAPLPSVGIERFRGHFHVGPNRVRDAIHDLNKNGECNDGCCGNHADADADADSDASTHTPIHRTALSAIIIRQRVRDTSDRPCDRRH